MLSKISCTHTAECSLGLLQLGLANSLRSHGALPPLQKVLMVKKGEDCSQSKREEQKEEDVIKTPVLC